MPVACGRTRPLGPGHEWPTEWRDAADALAGLDLAASGTRAAAGDGTDDAADESLATFHDARLGITTEGPDAGRIADDVMGADVRVAAAPDVARFESALLAGLNGAPAAMPG